MRQAVDNGTITLALPALALMSAAGLGLDWLWRHRRRRLAAVAPPTLAFISAIAFAAGFLVAMFLGRWRRR